MVAYSKSRKGESLLHLSDEVSRIAGTLAHLSTTPAFSGAEPAAGKVNPVSPETVRAVMRARRLRAHYFPDHLFADPAWDILLDLLHAEVSHIRVAVSSVCLAAGVPATTALRWLKFLEKEGLIHRSDDPHDGRRVFIELSPETSLALHRYFAELEHPTRSPLTTI